MGTSPLEHNMQIDFGVLITIFLVLDQECLEISRVLRSLDDASRTETDGSRQTRCFVQRISKVCETKGRMSCLFEVWSGGISDLELLEHVGNPVSGKFQNH
jgi:hypothetical protein